MRRENRKIVMKNLKIFIRANRKNEDGYVIIACLMVLMLVTIIGVMSVRTSNSDIEISTNHHVFGRSFYAADTTITRTIVSGEQESFKGAVEYLNSSVVPRGSGFQAGKFRAHNYRMICEGHGPRNSITRIEAGFYRIGF